MAWDVARTLLQKSETDKHALASPSARLAPPDVELDVDDFAADPSTTGVFALDGTATGYFDNFADDDWFAITVEAGETVEILTDAQTIVRFYDAVGGAVAPAFFNVFDFGAPGAGNVYFGFTATTTGTYYVAATGGSQRAYTLTATTFDTTHPYDLSIAPIATNGVALTGTFGPILDDWFRVELDVGESISLLRGSIGGLTLYNPSGAQVTGGNILYTAAQPGTYYLFAYGTAGQNYSLTPQIYFDDYADKYPVPGEVRGTLSPINGTASGVIEVGDDSDLFDITLAQQQAIRIVLTPTSGTLQNALTVELRDPNGTSYYGQVSASPGTPSVLLFSAPIAGTYTLVVESISDSATGAYTIQVTPATDDYSHDGSNTGAIVNDTISGNVDTRQDVDRFTFEGAAGQVIRIEADHYQFSVNGFTLAPVLYGPNGQVVAPSFVSQLGGDVILYRLPEDGEYSFDVRGETRTANPYHYQYSFTTIPDYAIPDALRFIVPANFALWTPVIDPGPVPAGPAQPENFVGLLDFFGLPIPETLNFTIAEGEVVFLSNSGTTAVNTQIDQFPALGMGGNAFTNDGTLWIENNLYPSMAVVYTFTDFTNNGIIFSQSTNSATGSNLLAAVFTNFGDIFAFSTGSYAVGAQFGYTPGGAINVGRIYAVATAYFATGVQIEETGGEFYNYGEIYAAGIGGATGIGFSWGGTVVNEGSIIAEYGGELSDLNANGAESRGIHNGQVFPLYVYNVGLIQADIAISTYGTPMHVINDVGGLIRGDILANGDEGAGSADTIYNDGIIDGDIYLNAGQDLYDGLGAITGALYLGAGDDAAVGGASPDRFYGGDGNDILDGWLGNDTLYGEAGDDQITGGQGVDRSMYQGASTSASWHRNPNGSWTVTSAEGVDTVTSTEFLDFTDRHVFLDRAAQSFTGDGTSDLLLRHNNGTLSLWFVQGGAITGAGVGSISAAWSPFSGDFNGDGRDDILWRNTTNGTMSMWLMNGAAVSGLGFQTVGTSWVIEGIGDFDGDTRDDILWRDTASGAMSLWFLNATNVSGGAFGSITSNWVVETLGDFNGDGRDDILWRDVSTGAMSMFFMNGQAVTGGAFGTVGAPWVVEGAGDYNGDGRDDIFWRNSATGDVSLWFMNGQAVTGFAGFGISNAWDAAALGDYNGDGRDDVIWRDAAGNMVAWFFNGQSVTGQALGTLSTDWVINPGG